MSRTLALAAWIIIAPAALCAAQPKDVDVRVRGADGLRELPGFGVAVPIEPPAGFEPIDGLNDGLFSSTIAIWRRTGDDGEQAERLILFWRILTNPWGESPDDTFVALAQNPYGSVRPAEDGYTRTARRVAGPLGYEFPAVRFERTEATADDDLIVRTFGVAANNVGYILLHAGPNGGSKAGGAAFEALVEQLRFLPPGTLGQAMRPGSRRLLVGPSHAPATLLVPEPFRGVGEQNSPAFSLQALDLTLFTHRHVGDIDREDFAAGIRLYGGGRDVNVKVDDAGLRVVGEGPEMPSEPAGWLRDDADLRLARPVREEDDGRERLFFLGGRRLDEQRWLWAVMELPARVVDDAGGEAAVTDLLAAMLDSAEAAEPVNDEGGVSLEVGE